MSRTDGSAVPDYRDWMSLRGRAVIVLGCGQGIGRQTAHAARAAGADVFCVDRDADLARDVATEVDGMPWTADVSRRDDVEGTFAAAQEALGRVDGVVDVVGLVRWASIDAIDDKAWNLQFDVGLRQAFYVVQIGSPYVERSGGGTMVFVASVSGLYGSAPARRLRGGQSRADGAGQIGGRRVRAPRDPIQRRGPGHDGQPAGPRSHVRRGAGRRRRGRPSRSDRRVG